MAPHHPQIAKTVSGLSQVCPNHFNHPGPYPKFNLTRLSAVSADIAAAAGSAECRVVIKDTVATTSSILLS